MGATELWLVRHGESVANVAAGEAERAGAERIEVAFRDADVPLSPTGERQARALGGWLAENATVEHPSSVWVSPYLRARQTIGIALEEAGLGAVPQVDERLRDRELGILDLLTSRGVDALLPDEAARRRWLGKFYYRPPGGESWADVALRVRSLLADLDLITVARPGSPGPVLIAAHDAVVMLFIYVCTGVSESDLLAFARTHTVSNASVTKLVRPSGTGLWMLDLFSHDEHVELRGVPTTEHSGDTDVIVH
ncbi:histidine phosphatase family protein [Subtercola sp. Z020]|uniref:histidine phosphatase family protein n=1 Tax=Subtercola sp. Z020 TaxID=2080582 RepID=UPI000CE88A0B|nr:histidine phosphatase family protein [Subtercola sp. Z020]PPF79144.1 histidine phosphatase family protein [Subtercola sp. Z020]